MTEETANPKDTEQAEAVTDTDTAEAPATATATSEQTPPAEVPQDGNARIHELERMVAQLQRNAQRREAEILLSRSLRERGLQENFTALLLTDGETDLTEDEARRRVSLLADAVKAAAESLLRSQIQPTRPTVGEAPTARLTPETIRTLPLSRLAEMMGNP